MEPRNVTPLVSVRLPLLLVITAGVAQAMGHTEQPQSAQQPRTRWLKVKRNTDGAPASGKQLERCYEMSWMDKYEIEFYVQSTDFVVW